MARYAVQITFEAPGLRSPVRSAHSLPGRGASIRLLGSDQFLAVSATVRAESATDAAMSVVKHVLDDEWPKGRGALKLRSWTAHRDRVLVGGPFRRASRRSGLTRYHLDGGFDDDGGEGGLAGVREPRRPKPGPPSLSAAQPLPEQERRTG
jgi:hypothetical protein